MRKLAENDIEKLRSLYREGMTGQELANTFRCSTSTVYLWLEEDAVKRKIKMMRVRYHSNFCVKCGQKIQGHKRCKICSILLHDTPCDCSIPLQKRYICYND